MRLLRYLGLRLALIVPVLFGVIVLVFLLVRVLPGDPVQAFVTPSSTQEDIEAIRARLGLDIPLWQQFLVYLRGLFVGDLGTSIQSGTPVATELATRLAPTLELVFLSVGVALVLSIIVGVWSAMRVNRPFDHMSRVTSLVGTALPEFWLGLVLIVVGYQTLHWFPAPSGRLDRSVELAPLTGAELLDATLTLNGPAFVSALQHLALPMLTIVIGVSASLMRSVRAAALQIRASAPWQTATAHGVRGNALFAGYLMRGTLSRIPTLVAIVLGNVLGGVVLVEYVFAWEGMGQWLLRGLLVRDYPVVQAGVVIIALVYAFAYLIADLIHAALDPRVRL
ncbi:ABC transporter permease [Leucobacter sp. CSA1]|uniref:ABC transporter permease n=1 Tax=Leucobacter chromiisoli TaxID=2796471 RepID=A0A934UTL3_9MICO|nr:ABC transporter permease [Leucobacter chromiisoli]MBK0417486.1 ABC transporter permease [Leucobacter chromiisoli]